MTRHRGPAPFALGATMIAASLCILPSCSEDDSSMFFDPSSRLQNMAFQDGIAPDSSYSGTRDAFLKEGSPFSNVNFGTVPQDTIGHLYLTDRLYERRFIVRFDLTAISDCGEVLSAELELHFGPISADTLEIQAYEVTVPEILVTSWPEGIGGEFGGVSWLYADEGSVEWNAEGGDIIGPPIASTAVAADTVISFTLPNALVLDWIKKPAENHGVVVRLAGTLSQEFLVLHTRESLVLHARPKLAVEYLKGG